MMLGFILSWLASVTNKFLPLLLDVTAKSCLIFAFAVATVFALRKSSASLRHWIWCVALLVFLLLPVLSIAIPKWRVLPTWLEGKTLIASQQGEVSSIQEAHAADGSQAESREWPGPQQTSQPASRPVETKESPIDLRPITQPLAAEFSQWFHYERLAFVLWSIGVGLMLLRIAISRLILYRLSASAKRVLDGPIHDAVISVERDLGIRRFGVIVYLSSRRGTPMTWGLLRSQLLLPADALKWDPRRLRTVLLHELAHVKHYDTMTHVVSQIVCALYWFHPLAWLAAWRLDSEREQACDDQVLRNGVRPSDYATDLLSILVDRTVPSTALAMIKRNDLEGRMRSILNEQVNRASLTRGSFLLVLAVGISVATSVAALQAELTTPAEQESALSSGVVTEDSITTEPSDDKPLETEVKMPPKLTEWPINVTGKALDAEGRPIAGATIFIVSTNGGPEKKLGQAVTDEEGNYALREIKVPIRNPKNPKDDYQEGTFQIFGKAPGQGFAWHGMKTMFVDPRFIGPDGKKTVMQPHLGYFPGEKIAIDLVFSPAKTISGRFVDDDGKPIAGIKLQMQFCDYTDLAGKERDPEFRRFRAMDQAAGLMPDQVKSTTDAEGNFSFKSVPPDVVCSIAAKHANHGSLSFNTATTEIPLKEYKGDKALPLPIAMTMPRTRIISATVTFADTKQPVPEALVTAYVQLGVGTSSYGYCDKNGKTTLKLPPGEFKLAVIPPKGVDYVDTRSTLVVRKDDDKQSLETVLNPGGVLIFKAVDITTGKGIEDVTFWFKDDKYPWSEPGKREPGKRWFVQSNTTTNNFPKTDETGELRAIIYPGSRVYGVGLHPLPDGYQAQGGDQVNGQTIDVPAGKTVTAIFFLKK